MPKAFMPQAYNKNGFNFIAVNSNDSQTDIDYSKGEGDITPEKLKEKISQNEQFFKNNPRVFYDHKLKNSD
jgi:hypothetical protein